MHPKNANAEGNLFLVDGLSLVFQAFYGVRGNLKNAEGMPTNAIFGFVKKILALFSAYEPTHLVVAFDTPGPTFRHGIYPQYKANREEAPEEFTVQVPYVFRVLEAMAVPTRSIEGYEADDIIGALARLAVERGLAATIVSADKDLFQLVDDRVSMLRSVRDDMTLYGPREVKEKMGVGPAQIADYLALVGDPSDNIPGVPRIGPKTAAALLQEFGSLDAMLANPDRIPSQTQRALLLENADQARLSRRLALIDRAAPVDLDLESTVFAPRLDSPSLLEIYRRLGFKSLIPDRAKQPGAAVPQPRSDYRVVSDGQSLEDLVRAVRRAGRAAVDTETTDVDTMRAKLVGLSLAWQPGAACYIPVAHGLEGDRRRQLPLETVRAAVGPLLADEEIDKIAQNAKFDMRVLARHGMPVRGLRFDTMLASYLLDPEGRHGLKSLASRILGVEMTEIDQLIGAGKSAVTMADVEIERAAPYACADADMTLRLSEILRKRLNEEGLTTLFEEIEMPLVEVLDAMEAEGVTLDSSVLGDVSRDLARQIDLLSAEIFEMAGRSFNVNSPKQVAEVLFEEIGLKSRRKTRTGRSTSGEVLEELAKEHPLPSRMLEFRQLDKMRSTYAEALPRMVNPQTGRIHTSFNQFIAATGRLSSSNPNLQNIPVRTDLGREIRRAFLPNGPDHVFLAADYSQIELRVLAHVTGDKALRQAFVEGADIHAQTAAKIFGMPTEMVTNEMRGQAKVINFGVIYGMGAHRLSRELSISHGQAQKFIDEYFAAYPAVREWQERLIEEAARTGCVTTLSGRRRMTPNLATGNRNVRANAVRMAINTPIQGSAADLIKIAMIALHREIQSSGRRARMVLQVHDELVFSLPESEVEEFRPVVRGLMEGAMRLDVPLRVDIKTGRTWAEC